MGLVLVVGLGGALGAISRFGINIFFDHISAPGYWGTLLVNLVGSFLIGLIFVLFENRLPIPEMFRVGIVVGLLGGFTTYSAFSLEIVNMLMSGLYARAGIYMITTVLACLSATLIGVIVARTL